MGPGARQAALARGETGAWQAGSAVHAAPSWERQSRQRCAAPVPLPRGVAASWLLLRCSQSIQRPPSRVSLRSTNDLSLPRIFQSRQAQFKRPAAGSMLARQLRTHCQRPEAPRARCQPGAAPRCNAAPLPRLAQRRPGCPRHAPATTAAAAPRRPLFSDSGAGSDADEAEAPSAAQPGDWWFPEGAAGLPWNPAVARVHVAWDLDNKRPADWRQLADLVR